ncbi:MAG: SDR family NAD(P)-dependent oxidoreductase [Campylobacteraceae bacterium]
MVYILITGASSGIGYAAAKEFAKRGENLILVARREERLQTLKDEIFSLNKAVDVKTVVCDLSNPENAHKLFKAVRPLHVKALINNAGFGNDEYIADVKVEKLEEMIRLNIESLVILSTLYVKSYENAGHSQIINVSSVVGYKLFPQAITYSATKFFVSAFTEGLNFELKQRGMKLRAKVLAPAITRSEFADVAHQNKSVDYSNSMEKFHTSEEMAKFLLKLHDSDKTIGIVNIETYEFELKDKMYL